MYLRFVFARPEPGTRRRVGILRALGTDWPGPDPVYGTLGLTLPVPPRAAFSGGRGLCWFKLGAGRCIEQVRALAYVLETRRGERIWQIYSRNPGLITYEDEFQVVAPRGDSTDDPPGSPARRRGGPSACRAPAAIPRSSGRGGPA